ncbi:hypothetical protein AX774_g2957 [Zancudomyces culisetae]|uniref:Uncharacterized protein n=1 Tax=Zancudomyces culisetae TaxID=1213189 RepID=A0A1R1PRD1_ZANCU|nr:hypothetical protein AX774_g2957 [Zancudomyces culisetae]|eukprot:OMH83540.1 hypothetical protein AX774_g2957 [Zancudomyces culisetae]
MQRIDSNYKTSVIEGGKKSGNCTDGCCRIYTNDCSNTHGVFFAKNAMKTNMYTVGTNFQTGILRNTIHSQQPLIQFPLLPPAPVRCTSSNTNMLFHGDITIDFKSENSLVMGAKRKRVSFSENITSSQKPKTNSKQGMGARSKKSINRKKKQKETQTQTQKKIQELITPVYLQHPKTTIFDVNNCPTATEIWPE